MSDLRSELQAVYDREGRLTPELVVQAARPTDSPLHARFDWDNRTAGESWRRYQAHALIRSVRVTYKEPTEDDLGSTVRAWHAVRQPAGHVYEPAEKVAGDPFLSALVLKDMTREWQALRRRYGAFAEFVSMVQRDLGEEAS